MKHGGLYKTVIYGTFKNNSNYFLNTSSAIKQVIVVRQNSFNVLNLRGMIRTFALVAVEERFETDCSVFTNYPSKIFAQSPPCARLE